MKITLVEYTQNAKELLILSKNTRHLSSSTRLDDITRMTEEEKDEEIGYVFNTISSSWEFVSYVFLLQNVSRQFTHQLVRHRIGTAFAQQSLRVFPAESFAYFIPDEIEDDHWKASLYNVAMANTQDSYNILLSKGADIQDARCILPIGICTNILFGINLRALSLLMETRLCVRAQGEFQQAAMVMKGLVAEVHPWADRVLLPHCVLKGKCQFPNFDKCPIKKAHTHLQPISDDLNEIVKLDWQTLMEKGYCPQPSQSK